MNETGAFGGYQNSMQKRMTKQTNVQIDIKQSSDWIWWVHNKWGLKKFLFRRMILHFQWNFAQRINIWAPWFVLCKHSKAIEGDCIKDDIFSEEKKIRLKFSFYLLNRNGYNSCVSLLIKVRICVPSALYLWLCVCVSSCQYLRSILHFVCDTKDSPCNILTNDVSTNIHFEISFTVFIT